MPNRTYTVRPWVKVGLPPMSFSPSSSLTGSNPEFGCPKASSTFNVISRTSTPESRKSTATPTLLSRETVTPVSSLHKSASVGSWPEKRTPKSFFGSSRDKEKIGAPRTPPLGRARGKSVPLPASEVNSRTQTPERNSDSALSMTPSTSSSKQIANWFSGLLGR